MIMERHLDFGIPDTRTEGYKSEPITIGEAMIEWLNMFNH